MKSITKGMLVASAAASLLMSGAVAADASDKKGEEVYCEGINACKGQGACGGADHSCGGQNGCKGKGIVKTTKDECEAKKGKIVPDPMAPDKK